MAEPTREEMIGEVRDHIASIEYQRDRLPDFDATGLVIWRAVLRKLEAGGWRPISEATEQYVLGWAPLTSRPTTCVRRRDGTYEPEWVAEVMRRIGSAAFNAPTLFLPLDALPAPPTTSDGGEG